MTDLLGGKARKIRKPEKHIKKADVKKLFALYLATNELMARLGADGEINTRAPQVENVMAALHEIDAGAPLTALEDLP